VLGQDEGKPGPLEGPCQCRMRRQWLAFVKEQTQQVQKRERLLGSSEVLESIIGKFKSVAGERGQHGLTGMVLSIGALVGRVTLKAVQAALDEVAAYDVQDWRRSHLGSTVQGLRRRITQALQLEQKQKPIPAGTS